MCILLIELKGNRMAHTLHETPDVLLKDDPSDFFNILFLNINFCMQEYLISMFNLLFLV